MKFALWLMNRFHVDSSLTGDLIQEWATGRSAWWLLWQTCVAIVSALSDGLWHNKLRTLAAVVLGLLGWVLFENAFWQVIRPFPNFPIGLLLFFLRPILLGWIVGSVQARQPLGAALLFISTFNVVILWLTRHSLVDYSIVLRFGAWLILTTSIGGLLATWRPRQT